MAVTQNTYTGNGSTTNYSFTFPYLETTDIKVSVNGVNTTAYTLANATTVSFNTAPANGASIRIYRQTDDGDLQATFAAGSAIRASDLNNNFTQNLYVTQEVNNNAVDIDGTNPMVGNLNMNSNRITNLAAPTTGTDATNRTYVDTVVSAGIPTGDKGDITVSNNGFTFSIDNDAVVEAKIANGAVTSAKIADNTIVNADVNASAGITSGKLAFTQAGTGAVQRTVESKLQDVVSVKDFGAVGDGVADDTTAIQAALNFLTSYTTTESGYNRGGRALFFPAGSYKVTSTLTVAKKHSITIYGEGEASCIFGTHDGVLLRIGDADVGQTVNVTVRNLSFAGGSDSHANSVCIELIRTYGAIVENCTFDRAHTDIQVLGMIHGFIRGCEFRRNSNALADQGYGVVFDVAQNTGGTLFYGCAGIHILDCEFGGGLGENNILANIYIRHMDGLYVSNTHIYYGKYGVLVDPDGITRNAITSLFFDNTYFDTTGSAHIRFQGQVLSTGNTQNTSKTYGDHLFSNCYFRDSPDYAIVAAVDASTDYPLTNLKCNNCLFRSIGLSAFSHTTAVNTLNGYSFNGCQFDSCKTNASGTVFAVFDNNAQDVTIANCVFSDIRGQTSGTPTSMVSLTPKAGASISITNNQYLVPVSNADPVVIGTYTGEISSLRISDNTSDIQSFVEYQNVFDRLAAASGTTNIVTIPVAEGYSGFCEYEVHGVDAAGAAGGFHTVKGQFTFRRASGGNVLISNSSQSLAVQFGTITTNSLAVTGNTPNFVLAVTNNLAGQVNYIAKVKVLMKE